MRRESWRTRLRRLRRILEFRSYRRGELNRRLSAIQLDSRAALVLGSAPTIQMPVGFDATWPIVTVNASQSRLDALGITAPPALTVFRNRILADEPHQNAVWEHLRGRSTEQLVMLVNGSTEAKLTAGVHERGYRALSAAFLTDEQKGAIIHEFTGVLWVSCSPSRGVSQGVFAGLLALRLGATSVVLSGISFSDTNHFYEKYTSRSHLDGDRQVLLAATRRGLPIFASEADFAAESGLPLWRGMNEGRA